MKSSIVRLMLCGAAIISAAPMRLAAAQTADSSDGVEEIIVTAQKREESLQKTPVAVTALTSTMLENRAINATEDLEGTVPDFQIEPVTASPSSVSLSMRGTFDETGAIETDESPVGLYIDGVYHARLAGATFEFTDIDRIEVLRGPQGTQKYARRRHQYHHEEARERFLGQCRNRLWQFWRYSGQGLHRRPGDQGYARRLDRRRVL
jgi:outer membrane receptor protein involved in Fe transport